MGEFAWPWSQDGLRNGEGVRRRGGDISSSRPTRACGVRALEPTPRCGSPGRKTSHGQVRRRQSPATDGGGLRHELCPCGLHRIGVRLVRDDSSMTYGGRMPAVMRDPRLQFGRAGRRCAGGDRGLWPSRALLDDRSPLEDRATSRLAEIRTVRLEGFGSYFAGDDEEDASLASHCAAWAGFSHTRYSWTIHAPVRGTAG